MRGNARVFLTNYKNRFTMEQIPSDRSPEGQLPFGACFVHIGRRVWEREKKEFVSMEKREHLGSRLGFILLSAGCAIGVGNVWKFPWMVGQYGGGAFVAVYLFFLIVLVISLIQNKVTEGD